MQLALIINILSDVMKMGGRKAKYQVTDQIKRNIKELHGKENIKKFKFVEDPLVIQSLSDYTNIQIDTNWPAATNCTAVSQINVESIKDTADCCIVGIVQISDTKLLCADFANKCLKVTNVETNTITSRRQLTYPPYDITLLHESRVAVTLPGTNKIHLYTTDGGIDQCGSIAVDGACWGIHWTGNKLLVSYALPVPKVQIMDLVGRVLKTIQQDTSGAALFEEPRFITYSPNNHHIYVSDLDRNTVTCITAEGEVQWTYKGQDLKYPLGLMTGDSGSVYVCSRNNDSIHVISAGGEKLAVISKAQSTVIGPCAVHYCLHSRTLYVSSASVSPDQCNNIRRLTLE